jgi:hypothetical protein
MTFDRSLGCHLDTTGDFRESLTRNVIRPGEEHWGKAKSQRLRIHINGHWANILGWFTFALMGVATIALFATGGARSSTGTLIVNKRCRELPIITAP